MAPVHSTLLIANSTTPILRQALRLHTTVPGTHPLLPPDGNQGMTARFASILLIRILTLAAVTLVPPLLSVKNDKPVTTTLRR